MKRARTAATTGAVDVGSSETASDDQQVRETEDAPATMETTSVDENLVDTVEQLRGELRRRDEELRQKDEELRAARIQFSELEGCSHEVEKELEGEIARLNRRNNELEVVNRNLERRLENELRRVTPVQMPPSTREVGELRRQIQRLEQDNDDLQMSVRRLEATREDLVNKLEHAEEQIIFAQQEFEDFNCEAEVTIKRLCDQIQDLTAEVKMIKTFLSVSYFLQFGLPSVARNVDNAKEIHEPPSSDTDETDEGGNGDGDGDTPDGANGQLMASGEE